MFNCFVKDTKIAKWPGLSLFLTCLFLIVAIVLGDNQPAKAIPAFARKYGVPCSACHTAWPKLNNFGQVFRDNGYQMMNDRDSPIWQNPSYFPITFRITPNWHRESTNRQPVDGAPAGGATVLQHGFDLSGMDIWTAGTLFKNVSFSLLPSSNNSATFHFENAFVRFDNLLGSHWLNLKAGKFELDNLVSEKRFLFLSANGGLYQLYHFNPVGDSNNFGLGDNQLGLELSGHAINSYTRYGVALLSSNEGQVGLPSNRGYDTYLTFSRAFQLGKVGVQRLGAYYYVGRRPTFFQTVGGNAISGAGEGNKSFYRTGVAGDLYYGKFNFMPFFLHGWDSAFLGTATPANASLPFGAHAPTWNGGFLETHYYYSPQLVFTGRYELVRMSRQAFPGAAPGATSCTISDPINPCAQSNLGNIDAFSVGFRWYPIMFSRAGLAWHNEYSIVRTYGATPLSGDGAGFTPLTSLQSTVCSVTSCRGVWSSSVFIGLDFDF
jgi:hypothetical protein